MKCPKCKKEYEESFTFCPYCGEEREGKISQAGKPPKGPEGAKPPPEPEKGTHKLGWIPMVTIMVAVLAVIGWVLAGVFLGTGTTSDEADTEEVVKQLIENVTDENYDAIIDQIDASENPLLGVLISEVMEREPLDIYILKPGADLRENRVTRDFIVGFFASINKNFTKGNVKSLDSRKLEPEKNYLVAVFSFDSDIAYPVLEINSGDGWKIDLAGQLVIAQGGETSRYVVDSVEALLSDPVEENCEKAIEILEASKGLKDKYELWLKPEAESLLPSDVVSDLSEGKKLTSRFESLLAEAEKAKEEASSPGEEAPTEPGTTTPTTEVITLTGIGTQSTQSFDLRQGLIIFHFEYSGRGDFTATLVDSSGLEIDRVANIRGPVTGSIAVGTSPGTYSLSVRSTGPWTIGIEEPAPVSVPYPPQSFSGKGPFATPFFQTRGGTVTVNTDYQGRGGFVVTIMEFGGNVVGLLANETGPYQGSQVVSLRSGVYYLLNIEAEGAWGIDIQ